MRFISGVASVRLPAFVPDLKHQASPPDQEVFQAFFRCLLRGLGRLLIRGWYCHLSYLALFPRGIRCDTAVTNRRPCLMDSKPVRRSKVSRSSRMSAAISSHGWSEIRRACRGKSSQISPRLILCFPSVTFASRSSVATPRFGADRLEFR